MKTYTDHHPITPPPELVEQWRKEPEYTDCNKRVTIVTMTTDRLIQLCEKSAQYGADQKLEACIAWLDRYGLGWTGLEKFRAAMEAQPEPKRPTDETKEAMISALNTLEGWDNFDHWVWPVSALEQAKKNTTESLQMLRVVLARYGTPAIQPVVVSERLPGPDDCDADGRCWWHRYTPTKEWHLQRLRTGQYNHWLPYWALPVPTARRSLSGATLNPGDHDD